MKEAKDIFNFENSYTNLPEKFYTKTTPDSSIAPELKVLNYELIKELGLDEKAIEEDGLNIFSGNKIPSGAECIAQAYAGHQFGHFAMLGDGRACLLGEHITPNGERFDVQLKGSGRTVYSRGGDGRAAIKPMLREYIISEGMNGLGIKTTRSLAVVTTGEDVARESYLTGAILTRIASSHLRVGTFQYASRFCSKEELKALADYTLDRHFKGYEKEENKYLYLLDQMIKNQAELISKWQLVGFIHGVMNTDNMTISGETIDYGPCAFMDVYDPKTVFSSIDMGGRYAYGNQPNIGGWDLSRFAETLIPLLSDNEEEGLNIAQNSISKYPDLYIKYWINGMRKKLGLFNEEKEDEYLIEGLLDIMKNYKMDFTNTFLALTLRKLEDLNLCNDEEFKTWYDLWLKRLERQGKSDEEVMELMKKHNPVIIPRNYRVEEALEAADNGDYSVMEKLVEAIKNPYDYSKELDYYIKTPEVPESYRTFCGT